MAKFLIRIHEMLDYDVVVEAESSNEACDKASDAYYDEKIILTADNASVSMDTLDISDSVDPETLENYEYTTLDDLLNDEEKE